MSPKTVQPKKEPVTKAISDLLSEESVFHPLKGDTDGRSALRREFVRAIKVVFENKTEIEGYCANISTNGVELITHDSFQVHSKAIIEIESLNPSIQYRFVAECRWCTDKGVGGMTSGWKFLKAI